MFLKMRALSSNCRLRVVWEVSQIQMLTVRLHILFCQYLTGRSVIKGQRGDSVFKYTAYFHRGLYLIPNIHMVPQVAVIPVQWICWPCLASVGTAYLQCTDIHEDKTSIHVNYFKFRYLLNVGLFCLLSLISFIPWYNCLFSTHYYYVYELESPFATLPVLLHFSKAHFFFKFLKHLCGFICTFKYPWL